MEVVDNFFLYDYHQEGNKNKHGISVKNINNLFFFSFFSRLYLKKIQIFFMEVVDNYFLYD